MKVIRDSLDGIVKELKWRILQLLFIIALQALLMLTMLISPIKLTDTALTNTILIIIILLILTILSVAMTMRWVRSRISMSYTLVSATLKFYRGGLSYPDPNHESDNESSEV